jgi:hypothetical protein
MQTKLCGHVTAWYVGSSVCNITSWCCGSLTWRYINCRDYSASSGWIHLPRLESAEFCAFKWPWSISLRRPSNKSLAEIIFCTKFRLGHMNTKKTHRASITKTSLGTCCLEEKSRLIWKSHKSPPPNTKNARAKIGGGRYKNHSGLKYHRTKKKLKRPYSKVSAEGSKRRHNDNMCIPNAPLSSS